MDDPSKRSSISDSLRQLRLSYRFESRSDGSDLWHVPFSLADGTTPILTIYDGPITTGVVAFVGDLRTGWVPPDSLTLLRIFADVWLTKLVCRDNLVLVTAELPTGSATADSLRMTMSGVLEGIGRINGAPNADRQIDRQSG